MPASEHTVFVPGVIHPCFDDYAPLVSQGRFEEARALLLRCQSHFQAAEDEAGLSQAASALADLAQRSGRAHEAVQLATLALHHAYRADAPEACALGHFSLASHLSTGTQLDGDERLALAHRLAAGVLLFQTGSEMLPAVLHNLALTLAAFAPQPPSLPDSFDDLCRTIGQPAGANLHEMVQWFSQGGGADGDEAMRAVIGLARRLASGG